MTISADSQYIFYVFCKRSESEKFISDGPSLSEIEGSLAGLDIEEVKKVLSVVQRDLEERQFSVSEEDYHEPGLQKKDSLREIVLKNVPIVGELYDESEYGGSYDEGYDDNSDILVNSQGHYERFDDISLDDENDDFRSEADRSEVSAGEIDAFLNDISEQERAHIIDVMCRDLEIEIVRHEKIRLV